MKTILISLVLILPILSGKAQNGMIVNNAHLIINDGANVYINGDSEGNLILDEASELEISGNLKVEGNIDNSGNIFLKKPASVIDNGSRTGSGVANLELIFLKDSIYLFGTSQNGLIKEDFTNCTLESYDNLSDTWPVISSATVLQDMFGYKISTEIAEQQVILSGVLNTGEKSINLSNSNNGWNLIGNPYPSGLDWDEIILTNSSIDPTLYAWNGTNFSCYIPNTGLSLNGGSNYISPNSAFFIKSAESVSFLFSNSERIHKINGSSSSELPDEYIKVRVSKGNYIDETLINFLPGSNPGFDKDFDAYKKFSLVQNVPHIYTKYNEINYAINSLPFNENEVDVTLCFKADSSGAFNLEFDEPVFENIQTVYLIDNRDAPEDLNLIYQNGHLVITSLPFVYSATDSKERFTLRFVNNPTDYMPLANSNLFNVYSYQKEVVIELRNSNDYSTTVKIYDILGNVLLEDLAYAGSNTFNLSYCKPGVYFVSLIMDGKTNTTKVILQ